MKCRRCHKRNAAASFWSAGSVTKLTPSLCATCIDEVRVLVDLEARPLTLHVLASMLAEALR